MITFVTVIYVIVCVFLILVVLLQAGRGGGMGAAMGGSSQTVFGGAGASNFLQRLTVVSASLFMLLSAVLAYLSSTGETSLERAAERVRVREEARHVETSGAQPGSNNEKGSAVDAGLSSEQPSGEAPANAEEAPANNAPAEGAPAEAIDPGLEEGSQGALDAVDDALHEQPPAELPQKPAEPAPTTP